MSLFDKALGRLDEVVELLDEEERWWEEEGSGW